MTEVDTVFCRKSPTGRCEIWKHLPHLYEGFVLMGCCTECHQPIDGYWWVKQAMFREASGTRRSGSLSVEAARAYLAAS